VVVSSYVYVQFSPPCSFALKKHSSKQADARSPVTLSRRFRVDDDVVWEWIGVGGRDGRDVVLIAVHDADNLMSGFLKRLSHRTADFDNI